MSGTYYYESREKSGKAIFIQRTVPAAKPIMWLFRFVMFNECCVSFLSIASKSEVCAGDGVWMDGDRLCAETRKTTVLIEDINNKQTKKQTNVRTKRSN